jgi:hypothetical protein
MVAARRELLDEQVAALRAANGPVVEGPAQQITALLYHLYLAPLTFWEVPNYAAATAAAEAAYQARPWQVLFHASPWSANLPAGALLLALTLAGLALTPRLTSHCRPTAPRCSCWPPPGGLLAAVRHSIAWQRYPVLPPLNACGAAQAGGCGAAMPARFETHPT